MKIHVVAVGGLDDRSLRSLVDDYLRRLRRYCAVEETELRAGKRLAGAIDKACGDATVVALDVGGETMTSAELARSVERLAMRGKGKMAFVIGGADGLPAEVVKRAHARWSLSALTFPHRLARLVLVEQLYRAMTILRGEPYAR